MIMSRTLRKSSKYQNDNYEEYDDELELRKSFRKYQNKRERLNTRQSLKLLTLEDFS